MNARANKETDVNTSVLLISVLAAAKVAQAEAIHIVGMEEGIRFAQF